MLIATPPPVVSATAPGPPAKANPTPLTLAELLAPNAIAPHPVDDAAFSSDSQYPHVPKITNKTTERVPTAT